MAKKEKGWLDALKKTGWDFAGDAVKTGQKFGEDVLKTGGKMGGDATKTTVDFIQDGTLLTNRKK